MAKCHMYETQAGFYPKTRIWLEKPIGKSRAEIGNKCGRDPGYDKEIVAGFQPPEWWELPEEVFQFKGVEEHEPSSMGTAPTPKPAK